MKIQIKYHEKVKWLVTAATNVETRLEQIIDHLHSLGHAGKADSVELAAQLEKVSLYLHGERIKIQPARTVMSPEERAEKKALKAHQARLDRTVSWLRRDGMVQGQRGIQTATGAKILFMGDPALLADGIKIRIARVGDDGKQLGEESIVDAMTCRPDFSFPAPIPARSVRKSTRVPAARAKRAPSKKAAAAPVATAGSATRSAAS
jgi:hypothetical protein